VINFDANWSWSFVVGLWDFSHSMQWLGVPLGALPSVFSERSIAKWLSLGSVALIPTSSVFKYILKKKEQFRTLWAFSNLINSA
jgi:hypothetical protein